MKKHVVSLVMGSLSLGCFAAHAESVPHRVAADPRVKIVMYDPNNVVLLKAHYGYQTQIVFAPNEVIQRVSLGDSMAWQANPADNNLFIKPMAASKSNMTVLTTSNSYTFALDSTNPNVAPLYRLQFVYPEGGYNASGNVNAVGMFDPQKLNWQYSFTGDKALAPMAAFDNGQFTYFKFKKGGMDHLPAVFIVDKDRHETLVNYHLQGDYLVVNSLAKQFTLRDGSSVTTVYNDAAIGDWESI